MKYVLALLMMLALPAIAGEDFYPEDSNWSIPQKRTSHEVDQKTQFCFSYIKGLKALWYDIHQKGIEQVMIDHPPSEEGMDDEAAMALAKEIEAVSKEDAQAWIEGKWNACMSDPYSVRR